MIANPNRDTSRPCAVVIGLDSMQGLQTARILSGHGIPVIAIAADPSHPCCRTRICRPVLISDTSGEPLVRTLERLGRQLDEKAVLYPCHDNNVLVVSRHRQHLERWYHIVLPPADVVEMMTDKRQFYTYAMENGFPIPTTRFLHSTEDARRAAEELRFPCVLKPSGSSPGWSQFTKLKAARVSSPSELLSVYDQWSRWSEWMVVQEWIEGSDADLYSCNAYFNTEGQPVATFIARKLRQWPPETGQSCLGEECRNEEVRQESLRLLRAVEYRGLGYVEMKRDSRSGQYFIVEPNVGRPTGRSAIAEAGGVELLYTMYCDAIGLPVPQQLDQKYTGVKWIHLRRDLQSAMHYWRRGELTLSQWWRSLRGRKAFALFSWKDPAPFLYDLRHAARVLLSAEERRQRDYRQPTGSKSDEDTDRKSN